MAAQADTDGRSIPYPTTYSGYLDPEYLRRRFGRGDLGRSASSSSSVENEDYDDDDDVTVTDDSEAERLAKLEWDESVRQLQLLLDVVLLPFLGKWAGRKWAYWSASAPLTGSGVGAETDFRLVYGRYQDHGFTKAFFGGVFFGEAAIKTVEVLSTT